MGCQSRLLIRSFGHAHICEFSSFLTDLSYLHLLHSLSLFLCLFFVECPSFLIRVYYLGVEVLSREVMSDDVRIAFLPPSPAPPSVNCSGFPRVPLPPPPSDLTSNQISSISTLLPYMDGGVVLTTLSQGVYAKRLCQGRVFWRGPHTLTNTASKMERGVKPTLIFNKQLFKQGNYKPGRSSVNLSLQ